MEHDVGILNRPVGWSHPRDFVSRKTGRRMRARNYVDEGFLALATLECDVERIETNTKVVPIEDGFDHTPYFLLRMSDESVRYVDVVVHEDDVDENMKAAREKIGAATKANGVDWSFVTEMDMLDDVRVDNARSIFACRNVMMSAGDRIRVLQHLDETAGCSILDAAKIVSAPVNAVEMILGLVMQGLVEINLEKPLVPETLIARSDYSYEIAKNAAA